MTTKLGLVAVLALVGCGAPERPEGDDLGMCPTPGWCWLDPTPQGNGLRASWGTARDDVWMVGDNGTVLHYDGTAWRFVASATRAHLTGVWGSAADDVWAWGPGVLVHWDGHAFAPRSAPGDGDLVTVWRAPGAPLLWASTTSGLFQGTGDTWGAVPSAQPAVQFAGGDANDVWAVGLPRAGAHAIAMHWDGAAWAEVVTTNPPDRVVVDGATTWFAGSNGSELQLEKVLPNGTDVMVGLHVDGHALGMLEFPPDGFFVATTTGKLVHAMPGDGREISDLPPDSRSAFWGADAMDLWVGGAHGALAHYASTNANVTGAWTTVAEGGVSATPIFDVVAGHGQHDAWALVQHGAVFHDDGHGWAAVPPLPETTPFTAVNGLAAFRDREMIATTTSAVLWFDGAAWQVVRHGTFGAIATAGNDVWVANLGAGTVDHWNGDSWEAIGFGASIGIAVAAPDDAWFANGDGVWHFDGRTATRLDVGTAALPVAIGALSRGRALVAFADHVVPIVDGVVVGDELPRVIDGVSTMTVRGPNDAWLASTDGTVAHFDGTTLTAQWSGTNNLHALFAVPHAARVIAYGALDIDTTPTAAVLAHD